MSALETIASAARAIRHGETTPRKLVQAALDQILQLDKQICAWVLVDEAGAIDSAERAAVELAAGRDRGALHGIPVGIKDIVDVAGMPTRAGSQLTSPRPALNDATVVERLRAAGAIILGKTVTTEFACFDPPPTRNPWNLEHTPGGSSSGSAAAVAVDMCFAAIASQTGGSITRPASYCGVAGCKPTFGLVSRAGVTPVAFHLDHVGVVARTAADCAIVLNAVAGDDPRDSASIPRQSFELSDLGTTSSGNASQNASEPPRLGVLGAYFFEQADPEVARLTRDALDVLVAHGARVVHVPLPQSFGQVHVMHRRLMAAEAADYHRRMFGAASPPPETARSIAMGETVRHAAPGEQAALAMNSPIRAFYGPKLTELLDEGFATTTAEYQEALRHQALFSNAVARSLAGVDALVTPATPTAAPASLATTGDPRFNSPWSHAGVPTVSIPCALTKDGMPLSLQLIGPIWTDARLLRLAAWCEQKLNFRWRPPTRADGRS